MDKIIPNNREYYQGKNKSLQLFFLDYRWNKIYNFKYLSVTFVYSNLILCFQKQMTIMLVMIESFVLVVVMIQAVQADWFAKNVEK